LRRAPNALGWFGRARAGSPGADQGELPDVPIKGAETMAWTSPKIVEIALGAEINSYASADARK
jgi:coenzyme PQQ precursor peptide PqqA